MGLLNEYIHILRQREMGLFDKLRQLQVGLFNKRYFQNKSL